MALYYGNTETTGSGNSAFRVVCEYTASNLGNGYYQYRYRLYIQVTKGNFYSTNVSRSWGGNVSISGAGNYGVSGWYTKNVAYGGKFTLGTTAYAQYTSSQTYRSQISGSATIATVPRPTYTVKYNANGGSGAPKSQTKTYGVTLRLSSTRPTRPHYTFLGWATSANGSVAYQPGGNYTANKAVTLYAKWQIVSHTITYNAGANGGTVNGSATRSVSVAYGSSLSVPVAERKNYTFVGWNTKQDGTGTMVSDGYTVTGNLTLYAIFELAANCRIKQGGEYKVGMLYHKVNGEYKTGTVFVKINGEYKQSTIS